MNKAPALLPVRIYGDKVLRQRAEEITDFDDGLRDFVQDLVHTMYERDGVGLAAPQVGVSKRVFVMDPHWNEDPGEREPLVVINPVLEEPSGSSVNEEGCISVPGVYADVTRPSRIRLRFRSLDNEEQALELDGYAAIVAQHEFDHLNGVLFTDHLGTIAKLKVRHKLKALESTAVNGENIRTDIYRP
jgi:peptide deformylase